MCPPVSLQKFQVNQVQRQGEDRVTLRITIIAQVASILGENSSETRSKDRVKTR